MGSPLRLVLQLVSFATGLIALATALIGLRQAYSNSTELELQRAEIQKIQKVTSEVALTLSIEAPRDGETLTRDVYHDMHGTYIGQLPLGYRLWVLIRDQYNFYLVYPPTLVTRTMKSWSQTNVSLPTPGRWELHVCVADEEVSQQLEARAAHNDRSGFSSLPDGMETVRYVVVTRK